MARILVVDDEPVVHTYVKGVLEGHGHKVFSARDTLQCPTMARQVSPDLIVLDISMPGGGGAEALRRLRMSAHTMNIPVLAYTALSRAEFEAQIREPDVLHVGKPGSPEELLGAVQRLLSGPEDQSPSR